MNAVLLAIILGTPLSPATPPVYPEPSPDLFRFPSMEAARETENFIQDLAGTFGKRQAWSEREYWQWNEANDYCIWSHNCFETLRVARLMEYERWSDLDMAYSRHTDNRDYWLGSAAKEGKRLEKYLAELRELLGEDAWQAGRMPLPAPLWAMEELCP